ncbi:MAG: hypothetical protein EA425_07425 [Puniceicoccaceae bacterium]|nr:MAG: hypothetical protein EA425_07425 [Puniceicoccaceae bacterium]
MNRLHVFFLPLALAIGGPGPAGAQLTTTGEDPAGWFTSETADDTVHDAEGPVLAFDLYPTGLAEPQAPAHPLPPMARVPEPSTYGLGAILLAVVVAARRQAGLRDARRPRKVPPPPKA